MRVVLGIATVLGITGVVAVFLLFFLAERVFHLDHDRVQTLMYLKLSIAGHLTIFLTRTRGPFWSIRPAKVLLIAVLGTQTLATLIAVYGLFMTPLGWGWAACVWGYALVWALVNDRVKLAAYWFLDRADAGKAKQKMEAKPESKAKPDATQDAKPDAKPAAPAEAKPDAKPDAEPAAPAEAKPDAKPDAKPAAPAEAKPDAKPDAESRATPQLVQRVHELYEELGREDVQAVQEWDKEKAARDARGDGHR